MYYVSTSENWLLYALTDYHMFYVICLVTQTLVN